VYKLTIRSRLGNPPRPSPAELAALLVELRRHDSDVADAVEMASCSCLRREAVLAAAGIPGLLFHDLRRSGARALRRAGVSEGVIMALGDWKTRSTFDRYNVTTDADLAAAMLARDAYVAAAPHRTVAPLRAPKFGRYRASALPCNCPRDCP
jgi:integrase